MEIGIDEQSTALLCLSLICVSLRPHSNNMATDLRHIWFQAIEEQDLSQIYRLLYSTPNADAGVGRLNWLIDHSGLPITEFPSSFQELAKQKLGAETCAGMSALSFAIFLWLHEPKSNRMEVIRTIATVSFILLSNAHKA